ncbi:MAG TPA: hypothetical protein VI997_12435 [Candidatus Thermoplasmatota archaeon]|nr:hypothetical protein [Candidatus Thermoplasmatota archaeon]
MKRATLAAVTLATATLAYGAAYVVGTSWNGSIVLPHDESGAGPLREVADSAARGWADGPTLVRVATTEGAPLDGRVDPPFAYDTSTDPHVGDGRALVWTFSYTAPSKGGEVFHASVGGDGSLLYARSLPDATWGCCIAYMHVATASSTGDDGSYDPAIAPRKAPLPIAFRIDAPEAYERVLGRAEFDGFAIDHPVFLATTELLSDGRGAVWSLAYHTATGYSADAAVDADTGEVLSVSAWPSRDPPPPPCYDCCGACPGSWPPQDFEGEWSGSLGRDYPWFAAQVSVEAAAYARSLHVEGEVQDALPGEEFVLTVTDASGFELARTRGGASLELDVSEFPTQGAYLARIEGRVPRAVGEAPVLLRASLDYGEEPTSFPPSIRHGSGEVWGWQTDRWYPLDLGRPAEVVTVTLAWTRAEPTQALELVLLDNMGNPVARAAGEPVEAGDSSVTLEARGLREPYAGLRVRALGPAAAPIPFALEIAAVYSEELGCCW